MINIVFEDKYILAVSKPANLLSVPGKNNQDNLFDQLKKNYPNVRLIHRLDMATSGLIIFALTYEAQKNLNRMFERREVKKRYCAIVEGNTVPSAGEIEIPLICDWPNRPKQKIDWLGGRSARTRFERVTKGKYYSSVYLYPITGRSHQLRVHCLAIGNPIVGDRFYAPPIDHNKKMEINFNEPETLAYNQDTHGPRLLLHSESLQIKHPISQQSLHLKNAPPFSLRGQ